MHRLPAELSDAPTCLVRRRDAHPVRAIAVLGEILRRSVVRATRGPAGSRRILGGVE